MRGSLELLWTVLEYRSERMIFDIVLGIIYSVFSFAHLTVMLDQILNKNLGFHRLLRQWISSAKHEDKACMLAKTHLKY